MKVGVNAIALSLPFGKASSPKEVVDIVSSSGIGNLTIPVRSPTWGLSPEAITPNELTKIAEMIPSSINVSGIGNCWLNESAMITDSPSEWKRNLDYAKKLCQIAAAFDAQHIVIGAPGRSVPSGVSYYDGIKKLVKFWKEVCVNAENSDVMFCVEHSSLARSNVGNTTKELIDLVDAVDSPRFEMIAQIGDMAVNDLDISNAIRYAGDRIKQVHIADVTGLNPLVDGWASLMLPGEGNLEFVEIFSALKNVGYEGEICLESWIRDDPISTLVDYRKRIEELWNKA